MNHKAALESLLMSQHACILAVCVGPGHIMHITTSALNIDGPNEQRSSVSLRLATSYTD